MVRDQGSAANKLHDLIPHHPSSTNQFLSITGLVIIMSDAAHATLRHCGNSERVIPHL